MISVFVNLTDAWQYWDKKSIVVKLKADKMPSSIQKYKIEPLRLKNAYLIYLNNSDINKAKQLVQALNIDSTVQYVEPNILYKLQYEPNDPLYDELWGLYVMYLNYAWNITKGNSSIKVCVVDTGIDIYHEDLSNNFIEGYDEVNNDNDIAPPSASEDHGTHVAGTILAVMDNNKGIVGVAPNTKLLGCRALTNEGGTSADIANCIMWCINKGSKVINMSLGSPSPSQVIKEAIDSAYKKNIISVAAAGNDGSYGIRYPAAYDNVIAVGALDKTGEKASFSNYGPEIDFIAPGVDILSPVPYYNQYAKLQGTSMAAPHVAGAVALILSINPNLSFNDIYNILAKSSIDIGPSGKDDKYGYGLIHVQRALLNTPQPTFTNLELDKIKINISKNKVIIESSKDFEIYSSDGRKIFNGSKFEGILNSGFYFVKQGRYYKRFIVF
ncbi:MAG: S8 family peptidase [candidate division WOR-3 bacterium]|nr:S8 family peptidase [candidate division WOR-3 bacterium]MCX7948016.1 S8 family peptidase [candidate division WOR-3 bacterium]MDW8151086.1 S8 family peptidase [candidate division WOR-3 bacterium]